MVRIDLNTSKNGAQECKSNNEVNPKTETKITTPNTSFKSDSIIEKLLKKK